MRKFAYNELGHDEPVVVTEDEIRATYWPYWVGEMNKAIERGSLNVTPEMITWENCLDDFIVVNWAWELPPDENPTPPQQPCPDQH